MFRRFATLVGLFCLLAARPATAQTLTTSVSTSTSTQQFIVRTNLGLLGLQAVCAPLGCTVLRGLDGSLGQLFLISASSSWDPTLFLTTLLSQPGIVAAEVDQLLGLPLVPQATIPLGLWDSTPVSYVNSVVWHGFVAQPASQIVRVADAQNTYHVTGAGIVAVIDTGVDTTHPVLKPVLVPGYDFTRNTSGGNELLDVVLPPGDTPSQGQPSYVQQSTVAVLDQSTVAVLDGQNYTAFGHGTMTSGVVHLVAPTAKIMPLKAFHADGTGYLSDILRAIYYGVQNHANILSMSFDIPTYSKEMARAMNYANGAGVICIAAAGNDGQDELVYPAALTNVVMGVASTTDWDTRSSFSNYGTDLVWMAAPGENIISTFPYGTYGAASGTSFSAPFVSGAAALLLNVQLKCNEYQGSQALAHAKYISPDLNNGRLDAYQAVAGWRKSLGLQ